MLKFIIGTVLMFALMLAVLFLKSEADRTNDKGLKILFAIIAIAWVLYMLTKLGE